MAPPIGYSSPNPGLRINRTEKQTVITGTMELWGPEATPARAAIMQSSINKIWTKVLTDGYSSKCNIHVVYRAPGKQSRSVTQVEAKDFKGASYVTWPLVGARTMTLNATDPRSFKWVAAHEFGHILGLDDHYIEKIVGGKRRTTPKKGWEGNLMAEDKGKLEGKNLKNLAEETAPSPYWINDDDEVRKWVSNNTVKTIRSLSTKNKLRAIAILMRIWISDEDVAAIKAILASVTSAAEAKSIRAGIRLNDFSSLGQRMAVRIALMKMPESVFTRPTGSGAHPDGYSVTF